MPATRRPLLLEKLEAREPLASDAYRPLQGQGINLQFRELSYNPTSGNYISYKVNVRNPYGDRGGFEVNLYWSTATGDLIKAGTIESFKTTTPAWGLGPVGTNVGESVDRAELDVPTPPSGTRYLVAVADPENDIHELSESDNYYYFSLRSNDSSPLGEPTPQPKKFVFLVGGWLSEYFSPSGMDKLRDAMVKDGRLGPNIFAINGRGTETAIYNDARARIAYELQAHGYTPNDLVYLVGHSLGGEVARMLASDVIEAFPRAQPADLLVTVDPIDYDRVIGNFFDTDQSADRVPPPELVPAQSILNLYQSAGTPKGYRIIGAKNLLTNEAGLDGILGNADDISHTSIDDAPAVHERIIQFLVARGRESRIATAGQLKRDGDALAEQSIWRPRTGTWHTAQSVGGASAVQWGLPGDVPQNGDFDGDGRSDLVVWRPATSTWFVIASATGAQRAVQWGLPGDMPTPGDFDGDGRTDYAVWRPNNGTWYIRTGIGVQFSRQWGVAGDIPVAHDYDGDEVTDIAVWRPANGTWYVHRSLGGMQIEQWGKIGDLPMPGDYDGDGRSDMAVFRRSDSTWWILNSVTRATATVQWGQAGDVPQPADFDGDGRVDIGIWRPANGTWYVLGSRDRRILNLQWGVLGDQPTANSFAAYLARMR